MESETLNQYTTLLGYFNGFRENDPTARYLLSISPVLETTLVLFTPLVLISMAYLLGMRWNPSSPNRKRIQSITTLCLSCIGSLAGTILHRLLELWRRLRLLALNTFSDSRTRGPAL